MTVTTHLLRGLCWDMDGTLIDSEWLHHQSLAEVAARFGLAFGEDEAASLLGATMGEKWQALRPGLEEHLDEAAWRALCREFYIERLSPALGRPGPLAILGRARSLGISQALVSNGEAEVVRANLDVLGIGDLFDCVVTADDCAVGKPDPTPYRMACAHLGLPPEACLAVEDSPTGLASATAAGLVAAAWPSDSNAAQGLFLAHHLILSAEDFPWRLFGLQSAAPHIATPTGTARRDAISTKNKEN